MSNQSLNPISRLLDVDFPEIKRSNWNNSYDVTTTADVGFCQPVFVDHVMAGTRCKLDFNSASFANSTLAPLYGRYKVKYIAIWAPDRLYMPDWLSGEKMEDDNYPYPYLSTPTDDLLAITGNMRSVVNPNQTISVQQLTGSGTSVVQPTSLASYLGLYPAFTSPHYFSPSDNIPNKNAFPLLAFWDAYRTFIMNPQEGGFYVRTRGFKPEVSAKTYEGNVDITPSSAPRDIFITTEQIDSFFKSIKRAPNAPDVRNVFIDKLGFDPIWSRKDVYVLDGTKPLDDAQNYLPLRDYHYGLPLCTFKPDMYTSWISNNNVELERSKSTVVADIVGDKSVFTMEQWYLASRIQSKIRKNLYKFDDFSQWIDNNFGVKPSTTLTQPMFLGAFESDIIFNDVISSVQQGDSGTNSLESNKDLGSRAAFGTGKNGNQSNFFDFTSKEPGTVMIIQMIVPEVFYFEGANPMFNTLNFNEEFNPIFDACGYQDLALADMNLVPNLRIDSSGVFVRENTGPVPFSQYNTAFAQQPYGMEHMGKNNLLLGQMVEPEYYQSWSLARSFNYVRSIKNNVRHYGPFDNELYSTYVFPEMFKNIFANGIRSDNFQFYLGFNYLKYQPVSKQFLSFTQS